MFNNMIKGSLRYASNCMQHASIISFAPFIIQRCSENVFHTIAKTPKVTIYDIGFDTDTLITYLHVCYIFSNSIGFDIGTLTT